MLTSVPFMVFAGLVLIYVVTASKSGPKSGSKSGSKSKSNKGSPNMLLIGGGLLGGFVLCWLMKNNMEGLVPGSGKCSS